MHAIKPASSALFASVLIVRVVDALAISLKAGHDLLLSKSRPSRRKAVALLDQFGVFWGQSRLERSFPGRGACTVVRLALEHPKVPFADPLCSRFTRHGQFTTTLPRNRRFRPSCSNHRPRHALPTSPVKTATISRPFFRHRTPPKALLQRIRSPSCLPIKTPPTTRLIRARVALTAGHIIPLVSGGSDGLRPHELHSCARAAVS